MNFKAVAISAAFAAATILSAASAQAAVNLVSNGSFETADFTDWTQIGDTGFTGVTGVFGGVSPTDGSFQAFFGPVGTTGGIVQSIATITGHSYTLSFDLHNFGGAPNYFEASFGAASPLVLIDAGAFSYTTFSYAGLAPSGGSTVLTFNFRQDPSYWLLDNISVVDNGVIGVPEPATWAIMLTGFFGAGAFIRRRRLVAAAA